MQEAQTRLAQGSDWCPAARALDYPLTMQEKHAHCERMGSCIAREVDLRLARRAGKWRHSSLRSPLAPSTRSHLPSEEPLVEALG